MVSRRLFLTISTAIAALFTFRRSVGAELLFVRPLRKELPRVLPDPLKGKGDISLLTGEGDARFGELMRAVRTQAEL